MRCAKPSRRACPACSASTSKGRSSTTNAAACTTPSKLRALDDDAVKLLTHAARRRDHGDAGAGAHHARHHPRAVATPASSCRAGHTNATYDELQPALRGGRARLHAPVQCHVAARPRASPAPSARRWRTRTSWCRAHRRWPSRASRGAEDRAARQAPRPLHAGERRHAQRRRRREEFRAPGPPDHGRRRPDASTTKAGSPAPHLDMASAVRNTVPDLLGIPLADAVRMASATRRSS